MPSREEKISSAINQLASLMCQQGLPQKYVEAIEYAITELSEIGIPKRELRMEAALYLPMLDGEDKEDAEDRMICMCERMGITLASWSRSEVITEEEDEHPRY